VDVYFGTFAKAFASIGGFSSCSKSVRDWISYNARTQVFAKSLPMIYVKSLQKTLELVQKGDANRVKMWENSERLKNGLKELGYVIGTGESPICAVFAPINGQLTETVGKRLVRFLRDRGVFATAITYPVIPLGLCMFRMIPTTSHTPDDVDRTIAVFREMRDELGLDLTMAVDDQTKIARVYGKGAA
jgi:glycine C-acetyltransferase